MVVVRVRVPYVHPIVCCTVKRAIRLLPSALLLIFVLSLILVTLVQIAVIHSHRRALYLQRRVSGISSTQKPPFQPQVPVSSSSAAVAPPGNGSPPSPAFHFWSPHKPKETKPKPDQKQRQNALQVEALLDRNAPSVDNNIKILTGFGNAARIRGIFRALDALNETRFGAGPRAGLNGSTADTWVVAAGTGRNTSASGVSTSSGGGAGGARNTTWEEFMEEHKTGSSRKGMVMASLASEKPMCPEVPPGLVGRIQVELRVFQPDKLQRGLLSGGSWYPKSCTARHHVAVVVPYRDRKLHLLILLRYLHPILQRQLLNYRIYVVEQFGNDTFNKGVLMNAGVREAMKDSDYHCFVFHDVDLIPEDDRNMYTCPPSPRHMSVAVDKFNYTLPYQMLVGGVFAVRVEHFLKVNGYSNLYWGWGGEDDDMAFRIKHKKLKIIRPPSSVARYTMIKHHHRPESPNNIRMALVRMAWYRMNRDGLSTVKYSLVRKQELPLYTHLLIDIGHNHKWHFSNSQKLIINL